jgi:hypothetical protein
MQLHKKKPAKMDKIFKAFTKQLYIAAIKKIATLPYVNDTFQSMGSCNSSP